MRWTNRLNYVLIFLAMAVIICKAQEDNYDRELRKFMEIYGKSNVDDEAKATSLPYFIDFLNRYSDRIPAELRGHFEDLKASPKIPDDETVVLVDSMPIQEGRWGKAFKKGAQEVAVETGTEILFDFYKRIADSIG